MTKLPMKAKPRLANRKGRRTIAWPITDPHGGYRFGLMRPGIRLEAMDEKEDYFEPKATAFQKVIWKHYLSDIEYVKKLAAGDDIVLFLLGDLIQGTILRDGMLVTPRLEDQFAIIEDALEPILSLPNIKRVYLCKGTGAHTMKHGSSEIRMARHIRKVYGIPATAYYHVRLNLRGVEFDLAHHGASTGIWRWISGDQIRRYTRDVMFGDLLAGRKPPEILLRGHYHDRWIETVRIYVNGTCYRADAAVCPGYSLFTDDYTMKATKSKPYMTVGTLPIEIVDGHVGEIHDRAHTIQVFRREVMR